MKIKDKKRQQLFARLYSKTLVLNSQTGKMEERLPLSEDHNFGLYLELLGVDVPDPPVIGSIEEALLEYFKVDRASHINTKELEELLNGYRKHKDN